LRFQSRRRIGGAQSQQVDVFRREPPGFVQDSTSPKPSPPSHRRQDYVKREVDDPHARRREAVHRDRHPKGAKNAPILLTRTPYNASKRAARNNSPHMLAILPQGDEVFVAGGYIRVFQDVRGKYKSEGDYVMTRPVRGPLNPTATDTSPTPTTPSTGW
jgi:uncharacterized protein